MRTFEQYIRKDNLNESIQNYIFGGTDNRNTNVYDKIKTFKELEDGDIIYWWVSSVPDAIRECVFKSWGKNGDFYTYESSYSMEFLDEKQKVYKEYYRDKVFVASTDAELIINAVNDIGHNVDYECIISEKDYYKKYRRQ